MNKKLLPETKIGEFLSMGVEYDGEEIGLFLASTDVSASCAFSLEEWKNFIEGIKKAEQKLKEEL